MAILDLYSNRRKRELGEVPDVFLYDGLPKPYPISISIVEHTNVGALMWMEDIYLLFVANTDKPPTVAVVRPESRPSCVTGPPVVRWYAITLLIVFTNLGNEIAR